MLLFIYFLFKKYFKINNMKGSSKRLRKIEEKKNLNNPELQNNNNVNNTNNTNNNNSNNNNNINNNKSLEVISNEKQRILNINNFSIFLMNTLNEIKLATSEYCIKVNKIIEKLNFDNSTINKFPERKFGIDIYKIIKEFIEIITKNFVSVESEKPKNEDAFTNIEKNVKQLEQILLTDIQKMELNKRAYHQEFSDFESLLIKQELYPQEPQEKEEVDIKEKTELFFLKDKNISDEKIKSILAAQKSYLDINKKLKSELKHIFEMINLKRKFLLKFIIGNFQKYLTNIYNAGEKINKKIDEEKIKITELQKETYSKQTEEKINKIFNDDIYEFKFLSLFNTIIEDSDGLKDKSNDSNDNNLLKELNQDNIENIVERIKKYEISFSKGNIQKLELIKNYKIIKSIIILILETPDKFISKKKENLNSLLSSSTQNQFLFLQFLNNYRANHNLNLKEQTINIFCEIFLYILNMGYENKNFKIIQLCIILSQTYYHENSDKSEEKDENKKYMINYMKSDKIFKEKKFWNNYLQGLIDEELNKINKNMKKEITGKQLSTAVYSSIFTLIKNMVDFSLDMDFISSLTYEALDTYNLPDSQKVDIVNYLIVESQ